MWQGDKRESCAPSQFTTREGETRHAIDVQRCRLLLTIGLAQPLEELVPRDSDGGHISLATIGSVLFAATTAQQGQIQGALTK